MKRIIVFVAILSMMALPLYAQRVERTMNSRWAFTQFEKTDTVNIPHNWNSYDAQDEVLGYYMGKGEYNKDFIINDNLDGREVFLKFEGVYIETDPEINGHKLAKHQGGYSAFCYNITPYVKQGANHLYVRVNNARTKWVAPNNKGDFTKFGGIYRDVELIFTSKVHIAPDHYASRGVYFTTPKVSEAQSDVQAVCYLSNADSRDGKFILEQNVYAPEGGLVFTYKSEVKLAAGAEKQAFTQNFSVKNVKLWDFDKPNVYKVVTSLKTKKGEELDRVENPLGFRSFRFDPDKGFFINGQHVKLFGTSHHQDYLKMGNSLTDEMMVRDMRMLKELGANYLRISHYPQDEVLSQTCDHLGIGTSIEIPMVNSVTLDKRYLENGLEQLREMIYQNYNNPSVLEWAYMNEILIGGEKKDPRWGPMTSEFAKTLDDECHRLDPYRATMIACHNSPKLYYDNKVSTFQDIVGFNLYYGWYGAMSDELYRRCEEAHALHPKQSIVITEFGGGSDPRLHSNVPERFDFTIEHETNLHKPHITYFMATDWIAGANIWNFADFYSYKRFDAVPYVNSKGLVTLDREKKDAFYLYQAAFSKTPYLMIGGRSWKFRSGNEGQKHQVHVFSNAKEVTLYLNGKEVGTAPVKEYEATFEIPYAEGYNTLTAKAKDCLDNSTDFQYTAVKPGFRDFLEMNVSLGDHRYFEDRIAGSCWMPEQEYTPGSWGYVGGKEYRRKGRGTMIVGTDSDIIGTGNDPIFQTQRVGIEAFKADLPDGEYYVYLDFSELFVPKTAVYAENLGMDNKGELAVNRVFSVDINGVRVLKSLNIRNEYGAEKAVEKRFKVIVRNGEGLTVNFIKEENLPILNAIRIYRSI